MFEKYKGLSGIYKINFPNGKFYIGMSQDISRRLNVHNRTKDNLPVHLAIQKYGKITEENVEILETCNFEELTEKEKYWIDYYNSYKPDIGYNLTLGGEGSSPGIYNGSAKLNQESLDNLVQELKQNKIFIKDLAKKYNLSPARISDINLGKTYYNKELSYPLRPDTKFTSESVKKITGVNKSSSKFNQEQLDEIINLLLNTNISQREIAERFDCCVGVINKINSGKTYPNPNLKYPLRKGKTLSEETICQIFYLIENSNKPFCEIAKELSVGRGSVEAINAGTRHRDLTKSYPLRKK